MPNLENGARANTTSQNAGRSLVGMRGVIAGAMANAQGLIATCRAVHFHFYPPEIRVGETLLGIVSQQVLGMELTANLAKDLIELGGRIGIVGLASGVVRNLDQSMLATGIPPRAGFNRHNDDGINKRLCLLRRAQGLIVS